MRIVNFVLSLGGQGAVRGCAAGAMPPSISWRGQILNHLSSAICRPRVLMKARLALSAAAIAMLSAGSAIAADIVPAEKAAIPYSEPSGFDWTGFYLGGHLGYAWGNSNWTASRAGAPGGAIATGSFSLAQPIDSFKELGSFFEGLQTGYNYMLANRFVIGGEADVTFPSYPSPTNGLGIGGRSDLLNGTESYSENVLSSGAVRGRIGYAPGNWLFYATGGFAWSYDQFTLTQQASGASESRNAWRLGWTAGGRR